MTFYLNAETVQQLGDRFAGNPDIQWLRPRTPKDPGFTIHDIRPAGTHPVLAAYLKRSGLQECCRDQLVELYYSLRSGRSYYALGWRNEAGGWEVINGQWRGCLGLKSITLIPGKIDHLAVFADFPDFLRWRKVHSDPLFTILVMNRPELLEAAVYLAKFFPRVSAYLSGPGGSRKLAVLFKAAVPGALVLPAL